MLAAGVPTVPATVVSIEDTGQLVDHDPVVDLVVRLPDGSSTTLRTIVSKPRVPRAGEEVRLIADPRRPGTYLYAGA